MSNLITIQSSSLAVGISPTIGASITFCRYLSSSLDRWLSIMPEAPEPLPSSSQASSFIMAPYSNRIRDGKFTVLSREYQLRFAEKHAIHGDVRNRSWQITDQRADLVTLLFDSAHYPDINFPFPFSATTTIQLSGASLSQKLTLTNCSELPMPAGFGFHPYFNRALISEQEDVCARFSCRAVYPHGGTIPLPTGPAIPVPSCLSYAELRPLERGLDHCFRDWDGSANFEWSLSRITMKISAKSPLTHLIVYTPPESPRFAFEHATHAIDSFNLSSKGVEQTGMQLLPPGESLEGEWSVSLSEQ